jgi:hypothetical protein
MRSARQQCQKDPRQPQAIMDRKSLPNVPKLHLWLIAHVEGAN